MFFFFFKQKTAYEMRISDWSSDVCSSDLRIVKSQLAEGGRGKIAVRTIPGHVSFQKQHIMPASGKGAQQGAVGGRVAIAPGGRQAKAKHHDAERPFHARRRSRLRDASSPSSASTWPARRA